MGQNHSVNAQININNPVIQPGQTLLGTVIATVEKDIPDANFSLLLLGIVKTKIERGSGQNRHAYRQEHPVLRMMLPLTTGAVTAGELLKHFQVQLPCDIPATAQAYTSDGYARVRYEAILLSNSSTLVKQQFHVLSPSNISLPAPEKDIDQLSVGACCCFSPASVEVNMKLDRGMAYVGDVIRVNYKAVNLSKQKFDKIIVRLLQEVAIQANGYYDKSTHTLCQEILPLTLGQHIQQEFSIRVPPELSSPTFVLPTGLCRYFVEVGLGTGCGQGAVQLPVYIVNFQRP